MDHHNCTNCGKELTDKYCSGCGQKAATHRFSTKHIFAHDFIHGVFHLDKGFLFTTKELLTRPGYSIREYVEGKRVNHFNYITFILLLITVNLFISSTLHINIAEIFHNAAPNANKLQVYMQQHMKEMQLGMIPFVAAINYFVFRRAKQNYAELIVMSAYWQAGSLLINTIILLLVGIVPDSKAKMILVSLNIPIAFLYTIKFYRQYFDRDYKNKFWLKVRVILATQLVPILIVIAVVLAVYLIDKSLLEGFAKSMGFVNP
jgi:hypothetical protein